MSITGSCHCGDTSFQVDVPLPRELVRCTCSFCSKRGALYAYCTPAQFRLLKPAAHDAVYRWNTRLVEHHACEHCGVPTWTDSPDFQMDGSWDGHTRRFGINARLIDGFDAANAPVHVIDGKNLW